VSGDALEDFSSEVFFPAKLDKINQILVQGGVLLLQLLDKMLLSRS
jgi:hypothetical protein